MCRIENECNGMPVLFQANTCNTVTYLQNQSATLDWYRRHRPMALSQNFKHNQCKMSEVYLANGRGGKNILMSGSKTDFKNTSAEIASKKYPLLTVHDM